MLLMNTQWIALHLHSTQKNNNIFSLGVFPVPGLWHSDAVRKQALLHQSGGICLCHPQHLPGHHLPVQLPATDYGRRPWMNGLHDVTSHRPRGVVSLASFGKMRFWLFFFWTFSRAKRHGSCFAFCSLCHPAAGVTCNFPFFFKL